MLAPFGRGSGAGAVAGVGAADLPAPVVGVGGVLTGQFAAGVEPPGAPDETLGHRRLVGADDLIEPPATGGPRRLPDLR